MVFGVNLSTFSICHHISMQVFGPLVSQHTRINKNPVEVLSLRLRDRCACWDWLLSWCGRCSSSVPCWSTTDRPSSVSPPGSFLSTTLQTHCHSEVNSEHSDNKMNVKKFPQDSMWTNQSAGCQSTVQSSVPSLRQWQNIWMWWSTVTLQPDLKWSCKSS